MGDRVGSNVDYSFQERLALKNFGTFPCQAKKTLEDH